jgi:hypothetical protein
MPKFTTTDCPGQLENNRFFVKKANAAIYLLQKAGLPDNYKVKVPNNIHVVLLAIQCPVMAACL